MLFLFSRWTSSLYNSADKNGEEIIIKGKGIGFGFSQGDKVNDKKIETIFRIESEETKRRFTDLILNVPGDCIDISEEIITMIKSSLNTKLSDGIYVTLTDHITNLLERIRMGISFDNTLLWNIRRMYSKEYQLGLKAVSMIREKFNVRLDDSEANFIALHIVNAELDFEIVDVYKVTSMIDKIYNIISSEYKLKDDFDDILYLRFISHLRFFFERLIHNNVKSSNHNDDLLLVMKNKYKSQYQTMEVVIDEISKLYHNEITTDEQLYLLIHIIKLTTNEEQKGGE